MRIVIDLDGVICPIKNPEQSYADIQPLSGAAKKISELRASGHYIIIQTARHMQTCNGNVGLVMKKLGKLTLDWLQAHGIEYDEIYFGKPNAHVYIDDRGFHFKDWNDVTEDKLKEASAER